jgi:toxin-antitoxin system PIN domain toxin
VKLLDLNLLLYAVNTDAPHHGVAKRWLDRALNADEPVAFSWVVLLGFLRIATNPRIQPRPLTAAEAINLVDGWLACPLARVVEPGDEHWRILKSLLHEVGAAGNLTTDAHLAALAIENGATLCSTDTDFQRFQHLRWINPLSSPA